MRKTFLFLVVVTLMVFTFALAAHADSTTATAASTAQFVIGQTSYTVAGTVYNMDAAPYIQDGRTLVPVSYLATALGAQTTWDGTTQTVTVTEGSTTIELVIGSTTMTVNGTAQTMDVAPVITNSRTFLPARYVADALGATVSWDATTQTVTITLPATTPPATTPPATTPPATTPPATTPTVTPPATTPAAPTNAFDAYIQTLPGLFNPANAVGVTCTYQFDITGSADPGMYWVTIANGACTVGDGAVNNPTLTITVGEQLWFNIVADSKTGGSLGATDLFASPPLYTATPASNLSPYLSSMNSYFTK